MEQITGRIKFLARHVSTISVETKAGIQDDALVTSNTPGYEKLFALGVCEGDLVKVMVEVIPAGRTSGTDHLFITEIVGVVRNKANHKRSCPNCGAKIVVGQDHCPSCSNILQ